jgi:hypothetical protein
MYIEDSPMERTPDLVAKIRALREQAEKEMNHFTATGDYDVRHVTGRKPKSEADVPPLNPGKKERGRNMEQTSIDFSLAPSQDGTNDGEEV